jgi:hypothetical protein
MIENCLLIHQNSVAAFSDWQKLSPIDLQFAALNEATDDFIDKKIDEGISAIAIVSEDFSNQALALIGTYLNLDAATLLGTASAGNDDLWISDCIEIRDQIAKLRTYKTDKKLLVSKLAVSFAQDLLRVIEKSLARNTKTFLVSDISIGLAFLLARENSQAKKYLIPAKEIVSPGLNNAIDSAGFESLAMAPKTNLAKALALTLLSHM